MLEDGRKKLVGGPDQRKLTRIQHPYCGQIDYVCAREQWGGEMKPEGDQRKSFFNKGKAVDIANFALVR